MSRYVKSPIRINQNGGAFHQGRQYSFGKKLEVAQAYLRLYADTYPTAPTTAVVAHEAKVGYTYAKCVIEELQIFGHIIDPDDKKNEKTHRVVPATSFRQNKTYFCCRWGPKILSNPT